MTYTLLKCTDTMSRLCNGLSVMYIVGGCWCNTLNEWVIHAVWEWETYYTMCDEKQPWWSGYQWCDIKCIAMVISRYLLVNHCCWVLVTMVFLMNYDFFIFKIKEMLVEGHVGRHKIITLTRSRIFIFKSNHTGCQ